MNAGGQVSRFSVVVDDSTLGLSLRLGIHLVEGVKQFWEIAPYTGVDEHVQPFVLQCNSQLDRLVSVPVRM